VELVNEFRVPVPIDQAWQALTDVERIAPCLPGAQLLDVDGDEFTGAVKVKLGPITVQYKGKAVFEQKDVSAHRAVIKASGRETRGQGSAAAVVTAELKEDGDTTTCVLSTDLTISGKAAQFGRGVLADVSSKLIQQFADNLAADVAAAGAPTSPTAISTPSGGAQATTATESVDLLSLLALPMVRRSLPAAALLVAGIVIGWLLRGKTSGPS
jgi:carbon monoxide dehydrogenase subunit G